MRQNKVKYSLWIMAAVIILSVAGFSFIRFSASKNSGHQHTGESTEQRAELSGELEDGIRVIEMKARQFAFDPDTITVKEGEKIRLEITSEDVAHGFHLGDYGINRRLNPNETIVIEFEADQAGEFIFDCSVYCGKGHEDMTGNLNVLNNEVK